MATFVATTACNGPRVNDPEAAKKVLDRYLWESDVAAAIKNAGPDGHSYLELYGYDWPDAWKIPDGVDRSKFEPDYDADPNDGFEEFLKELAPFLAEPLTVQAVGSEKCRFPLAACEWHIPPGAATVEVTCFNHSS